MVVSLSLVSIFIGKVLSLLCFDCYIVILYLVLIKMSHPEGLVSRRLLFSSRI